ncbi:transposase [Pseudokineococcus sp. 1T1Z-3]|uniref:transposase n=1 Tax=Pseudokineococcus sp. 1T1Z-3 TaxID=3132745 RepID=UPI00403F14A7
MAGRKYPGRSGWVYADWLQDRGEAFRAGVATATLDPFHGDKKAIDDKLADATSVVDPFLPRKREYLQSSPAAALDDVRRRVQETAGHRGDSGDPVYDIRTTLRAGIENLTDRQLARLEAAFAAHPEHDQAGRRLVLRQQLRSIYHQPTSTEPHRRYKEPGCPGLPRRTRCDHHPRLAQAEGRHALARAGAPTARRSTMPPEAPRWLCGPSPLETSSALRLAAQVHKAPDGDPRAYRITCGRRPLLPRRPRRRCSGSDPGAGSSRACHCAVRLLLFARRPPPRGDGCLTHDESRHGGRS